MKNYLKKIISVILICAFIFSYPVGLFARVIDLREEGSADGWAYATAILSGFYSGYNVNTSLGPSQMFVRTYLIPKLSEKLVWEMGIHNDMVHAVVSSGLSSFVDTKLNYGEVAKTTAEKEAHSLKSAIFAGVKSAVVSGLRSWLTRTVYNKYKNNNTNIGFAQFVSFISGMGFDLVSAGVSSVIASYNQNKTPPANADATIMPDPDHPEVNGLRYKLVDGNWIAYEQKDKDGKYQPIAYEDREQGVTYQRVDAKNKNGFDLVPFQQKDKDGNYQPINNKNSFGKILKAVLTGRGCPSTIHIRLRTEDKANVPGAEQKGEESALNATGATPSGTEAAPSKEEATPIRKKGNLTSLVDAASRYGPWSVLGWLTKGYEKASEKFGGWAVRMFGRKEADLSTAFWLDEYAHDPERGWEQGPSIQQRLSQPLQPNTQGSEDETDEYEDSVPIEPIGGVKIDPKVNSENIEKMPAGTADSIRQQIKNRDKNVLSWSIDDTEIKEVPSANPEPIQPKETIEQPVSDVTIPSTTLTPITQLNKELPESAKEEIQTSLSFDTKLQYREDLPEEKAKNPLVKVVNLTEGMTNSVLNDAEKINDKVLNTNKGIGRFIGIVVRDAKKATQQVFHGKERLPKPDLEYKEASEITKFSSSDVDLGKLIKENWVTDVK